MPKYKVGDVAALFPKPAEPKTESGKKIQSLFEEFYKKPSKKVKNQNQAANTDKQAGNVAHKEAVETVIEKKPKKEKRKFQNANSNPVENTGDQVAKKPKVELAAPTAPFPRSKKDKNPKNPSYLSKSKDVDFEIDGPEKEDLFPRKKGKHVKFDQDDDSSPQKKKNAKNNSANDQTESSSVEQAKSNEENNLLLEERKKKRKEKKLARKAAKAQENELPDFLRLPADDSNSKAVFRMKKQRVIPSCREIFQNKEQTGNACEQNDGGMTKPFNQEDREFAETEERLSRTLFVGNLPVNTTKKDLAKLFKPFGTLESYRMRGAISSKSTIPRKIAEIKGKYHANMHNRIAFVVLKNRKSAIEALSLSGTLVDGHHIVVDRATTLGAKKMYDEKRTIFVGNLPFNIKDDTLWNTFLPCGSIEFVRVIRDRETGTGKGFGYVSFQKIQGKEKALALTNLEIEGRTLRIQSCEKNQKHTQNSAPWRGIGKKIAKKQKMKNINTNSRKTIKKLINRGKQQHQKKKIAGIFKKFSQN